MGCDKRKVDNNNNDMTIIIIVCIIKRIITNNGLHCNNLPEDATTASHI